MSTSTVPRDLATALDADGKNSNTVGNSTAVGRRHPLLSTEWPPGTFALKQLFDAYRNSYSDDPEQFKQAWQHFSASTGTILNCYFADAADACVALVERKTDNRPYLLVWFKPNHLPFHVQTFCEAVWRTLWISGKIERLCDSKVSGPTRVVVTEMLHNVAVLLLAHLDVVHDLSEKGGSLDGLQRDINGTLEYAAHDANAELDKLEQYIDRVAVRTALRYYFLAFPLGIGMIVAILVGVARAMPVDNPAAQALLWSIGVGGIGSVTSVMFRVTRGQKLSVDTSQGRLITSISGFLRPFVGAVFGGVIYALVVSGLFPLNVPSQNQLHFYAALAFVAGFSERWAQDTIIRSAPVAPSPANSALTMSQPKPQKTA